jgi:excisionase family DNA binding protein
LQHPACSCFNYQCRYCQTLIRTEAGKTDTAGERFYTISEVARLLEVSDQSIRRWVKAGELRAYKPKKEYRIAESDLEEFLKERRVPLVQARLLNFEERRPSIVAKAILTAAERWASITGDSGTDRPRAAGIYLAAADLENLLSVVVGDGEMWGKLSSQERSEIANVMSAVGRVTDQYHTRWKADRAAEEEDRAAEQQRAAQRAEEKAMLLQFTREIYQDIA